MAPVFCSEEREEIQEKLLQTGIVVIKEKGIWKMTIDEVTRRVGIGKGTFYHFYDSKESYVMAVIHFSKKRILEAVHEVIDTKGGVDRESFLELLNQFGLSDEWNLNHYITPEDELWLAKKLPQEQLWNPEREEELIQLFLGHALNVRPDRNLHVIANLMKLFGLAMENKSQLYEDALSENLAMLAESLADYIYIK